jgi:hypothetical protein
MGSVYCKYIATKQSRKGRKRPSYNGNIFVVTFIVQLLILTLIKLCVTLLVSHQHGYRGHISTLSHFALLGIGKCDMENIYDGLLWLSLLENRLVYLVEIAMHALGTHNMHFEPSAPKQ